MSTQNGQPALPDSDTAFNNLVEGVECQVFFNKMAAYGHVPQTPEQAAAMLDTGRKLYAYYKSEQVKQAQDANDPYVAVNHYLSQVLGDQGADFGAANQQAHEAAAIKQAAAELAQDPVFYNSVLALKAAEAQTIQEQLMQRG